jgi:hypothetical protein
METNKGGNEMPLVYNIYIYIYIERERERKKKEEKRREPKKIKKKGLMERLVLQPD